MKQINAYTIGHKASYDQYLSESAEPKKLGRQYYSDYNIGGRIFYTGGAVWKTKKEAEQYIIDNQSDNLFNAVYGLVLPNGWDIDVDSGCQEENGYSDLLTDSIIISLE